MSEARVWRTYVKEADKLDKEMVDGRNKFVIESLEDLKPDYAESSAQTLLVIARALAEVANSSSVMPSKQVTLENPEFSPSRSAVIVNTLWFLSLSLSVAVSLIAMLAKEWCHKFMSGRSGPAYEQARRRQHKWNGIEKWKMREVLTYLPGVLHLALLLFAIGLCIYIWDINAGAAVPVVVVTAAATLVYVFASLLPVLDQSCPYSTPIAGAVSATEPLVKFMKRWAQPVFAVPAVLFYLLLVLLSIVFSLLHFLASLLWVLLAGLGLLVPIWVWEHMIVGSITFLRHTIGSDIELQNSNSENTEVPMTIITSQMLAWMIMNCEDSRSVDVALQAIGGAHNDLPYAPLAQCGALNLALSRLNSSALPNHASKVLSLHDLAMLATGSRFARSCVVLIYLGTSTPQQDRWGHYSGNIVHRLREGDANALYYTYMR
ncbi:hypothetical protein FRC12_002072 [Ceratobasidium sp. 428]|nr:hypothetical protein FRC12_002072 [Ceratobasidium sp. 428]